MEDEIREKIDEEEKVWLKEGEEMEEQNVIIKMMRKEVIMEYKKRVKGVRY